jgi:hypothetical protein
VDGGHFALVADEEEEDVGLQAGEKSVDVFGRGKKC